MYIANSRVKHFRNYLRFINICNSNQHLCSATCHILSVIPHTLFQFFDLTFVMKNKKNFTNAQI